MEGGADELDERIMRNTINATEDSIGRIANRKEGRERKR